MPEYNVNRGFELVRSNGVVYFKAPSIEKLGYYKHGFSSRIGGVSEAPFDSLNLSFTREKNEKNRIENFSRLANAVGVSASDMVLINYEHGVNIEEAGCEHRGMGISEKMQLPFCDGLIVTEPGVCAVSLHADCTPIFFADKKGRAAGVCHAGWRGVHSNIVQKIASKMKLSAGIEAYDIVFAFGAFISSCCFEVKDDVSSLFLADYGEEVRKVSDGVQYIDMEYALTKQLERSGVPSHNVTFMGMCTSCEKELFYSYRRDSGQTGAQAGLIQINQPKTIA